MTHNDVMAGFCFSRKTFSYFDGARRHSADKDWFDAHRKQYTDHVEVPFTHLVLSLKEQLADSLPGIAFSPRRISKPLKRQTKDNDGPLVRSKATALFAETATSMFESNPGIYLSFGAGDQDNICACGLYMPSSRQIKELRPRFGIEHKRLKRILGSKDLRRYWTGLSGDLYKRFPKEFEESAPGSEFLWHKQFFLSRTSTREEVLRPDFIAETVDAITAAIPFLTWARDAVGIYRKPRPRHAELD